MIVVPQAPWFEWTGNAISDLGRADHGLPFFNWSLTIIGVLLLVFSIGLVLYLKQRIGPTLIGISSIYFIAIGLYPLPNPIHVDTSSLFFIAFPLGFFMLGYRLRMRKEKWYQRMRWFAFTVPILAIASPVMLLFGEGIAVPELMILLPGFFWCAWYGVHLLQDMFRKTEKRV